MAHLGTFRNTERLSGAVSDPELEGERAIPLVRLAVALGELAPIGL